MPNWIVGVVINVVGSVTIALGTNLMKVGHSMCDRHQQEVLERTGVLEPVPRLLTSPRKWWHFRGCKLWSLGTLLFLAGNVANFGSLAFAAQSLIAALGSVQLIANLFLSRWVTREPVSLRIWVATAIIVAGGVLLVAFGNHESPTYTVQDLKAFYHGPSYISYMCVGGVLCVASYVAFLHGKRRILAERAAGTPSTTSRARWQRWMPFLFSMYAALLGTQSVIYGKTLAMLLRTTLAGDSQIGNWYTWLSLIIFGISAIWWGTRYNQALKLFPVSLIYPVLMTIWLLTSVIAGSMYYQEYKSMSVLALAMFGGGVAILLVGMFVLSEEAARTAQVYSSECEEQVEDEEGGGLRAATTHDNELFIEALAKKEAKLDFINPLASSPSTTDKTVLRGGMPDSLIGTGIAAAPASLSPAARPDIRHAHFPDADNVALITAGDSAAPPSPEQQLRPEPVRRPTSVPIRRLMVVVENSARDEAPPSLMHELAEDFGFGDILQSVRQSIGLERASTPAFPVFGFPQPNLPSRTNSTTSARASNLRQHSATSLGPRPAPMHRYLVGSVHQGPSAAPQAMATAKEQLALDAVLGAAGGCHTNLQLGQRKLVRSCSEGELQDIVIKSARPGECSETDGAASASDHFARPSTSQPLDVGRLRLSLQDLPPIAHEQQQASREPSGCRGTSPAVMQQQQEHEDGSMASEARLHEQQLLEDAAPNGGYARRASSLPRETVGALAVNARRPWNLPPQRGTPHTPRHSFLHTGSNAGDEELSSAEGSGRLPKKGLVSPRDFLEDSLSPSGQLNLADLLRQQASHDKAE